jgi:hypothetical protein
LPHLHGILRVRALRALFARSEKSAALDRQGIFRLGFVGNEIDHSRMVYSGCRKFIDVPMPSRVVRRRVCGRARPNTYAQE